MEITELLTKQEEYKFVDLVSKIDIQIDAHELSEQYVKISYEIKDSINKLLAIEIKEDTPGRIIKFNLLMAAGFVASLVGGIAGSNNPIVLGSIIVSSVVSLMGLVEKTSQSEGALFWIIYEMEGHSGDRRKVQSSFNSLCDRIEEIESGDFHAALRDLINRGIVEQQNQILRIAEKLSSRLLLIDAIGKINHQDSREIIHHLLINGTNDEKFLILDKYSGLIDDSFMEILKVENAELFEEIRMRIRSDYKIFLDSLESGFAGGGYYNPVDEFFNVARPITSERLEELCKSTDMSLEMGNNATFFIATIHAELQSLLMSGEILFAIYEKVRYKIAVYISCEERLMDFEMQVRRGTLLRYGFFGLGEQQANEGLARESVLPNMGINS